MTKEMVVTLSERLDRMGLGMDNGNAIRKQDSTRIDAPLVSVISTPLNIIFR